MSLTRIALGALIAASLFAFGSAPQPASAAGKPTIAVIAFDTAGLANWWESGFEPGKAISDLLTDELVNSDKYNVVDRDHIDALMQEKNLVASGDVSPATAIQLGRLIGAQYLVVGKVVEFNHTSSNSGAIGGLLGSTIGGSGVRGEKVTLKVSVKVIEASTGRIVQAFHSEKAKTGTSFVVAGFAGHTAAAYSSETFKASTMGKLMDESAVDMSQRIDPARMVATSASANISGRVASVSGGDIILNVGSNKGVQTGMFFDVFKLTSVKDPDTGRMLTSRVMKAKIQIISVDADTSVGKKVSGSVEVGNSVQSE